MRKLYSLLLALVALTATAQTAASVTFPKVKHWTGTGSKQAALVIAWHDGEEADTLVWGYRFDGMATSAQMLEAVVKSDPRLYAAVSVGQYGLYVEGLGYDRDNDGELMLLNLDASAGSSQLEGWWQRAKAGVAVNIDSDDHFFGGYNPEAKMAFTHLISDNGQPFKASLGASTRQLADGSIDVWSYQAWDKPFALTTYTAVPAAPFYKKGLFVVNEDWFGHSSGTVNHFDTDTKTWSYRIYRQANPEHTLGNTTQFGTIYGGRFYLLSKQNFKNTGGRLVVANALNMAEIEDEETLPGESDGRALAFASGDNGMAFVTTSKGIALYDVEKGEFVGQVDGVKEECGRILPAGYYLFVEAVQSQRVLVVDPELRRVVEAIPDASLPTLAKDGTLWVLRGKSLVSYDIQTFDQLREVNLGSIAPSSSKGAWNAGLLMAGVQSNNLYWGYGKGFAGASQIYRLNLDDEDAQPELLYDLTGKSFPNIYGAAMGIRPTDDHIFFQAFKGFGDKSYALYELDSKGKEVSVNTLTEPYFWFPSTIVFPDLQAPTFTLSEAVPSVIGVGESKLLTFVLDDADSPKGSLLLRATAQEVGKWMESEKEKDPLEEDPVLSVIVEDNSIFLEGRSEGTRQLLIAVGNNGLFSMNAYLVKVSNDPTGIAQQQLLASLKVQAGRITATDLVGETLTIHDLTGRQLAAYSITSQQQQFALPKHHGTLVLRAGALSLKVQP